jgi:hypothetical protein
MIAALLFLGAAYAAFCLWLAVRFINRRERWAKRTIVGVAALTIALYPWSWGPSIFVCEKYGSPSWMVTAMEVYRPMVFAVKKWGRSRILMPYILYTDWWIGGSSFAPPDSSAAASPDAPPD